MGLMISIWAIYFYHKGPVRLSLRVTKDFKQPAMTVEGAYLN